MRIEDIVSADLPGVSLATRNYLSEAAVVCLERQQHKGGVIMDVQGDVSAAEPVCWNMPYTDQMDRSWFDQEVATEHGACCLSILWAVQNTPYTVIRRSRKKSGIDYWLGKKDSTLFQDAARLEVSGIFNGNSDSIDRRVKKKVQQSSQSDGTKLPAYISVVEFSSPTIHFHKK